MLPGVRRCDAGRGPVVSDVRHHERVGRWELVATVCRHHATREAVGTRWQVRNVETGEVEFAGWNRGVAVGVLRRRVEQDAEAAASWGRS